MKDVSPILEQHERLVFEVAYRLGAEENDDAIQSGRIGLWEAAKAWDGVRPFEPLARCCIRHNIIDYLRKSRRQEDELTDDVPAEEIPDDETKEELVQRVKSLFPRRSRERRVILSIINGKDKRSIAKRMGVSERTVDRIARKAAERMQKEKQGQ